MIALAFLILILILIGWFYVDRELIELQERVARLERAMNEHETVGTQNLHGYRRHE